jgi:hypothetical protein
MENMDIMGIGIPPIPIGRRGIPIPIPIELIVMMDVFGYMPACSGLAPRPRESLPLRMSSSMWEKAEPFFESRDPQELSRDEATEEQDEQLHTPVNLA